MSALWVVLAFLVLVAGLSYRRRIRAKVQRGGELDDDQIRRIESTGRLEMHDEPLDMEEIERAETEFWEERWDEPEPW